MFKQVEKQTNNVAQEVKSRITHLSGRTQIIVNFSMKAKLKGSAYAKMDEMINEALTDITDHASQLGYVINQVTTTPSTQRGVNGQSTITYFTIVFSKGGF